MFYFFLGWKPAGACSHFGLQCVALTRVQVHHWKHIILSNSMRFYFSCHLLFIVSPRVIKIVTYNIDIRQVWSMSWRKHRLLMLYQFLPTHILKKLRQLVRKIYISSLVIFLWSTWNHKNRNLTKKERLDLIMSPILFSRGWTQMRR